MTSPNEITITHQPRPVVENAHNQTFIVRLIAAAQMILAALPFLLLEFEAIRWTAGQMSAFSIFLGVVITAALLLVGQQVKSSALDVESQVTPVASPRDDGEVPLVPIADDGLDD